MKMTSVFMDVKRYFKEEDLSKVNLDELDFIAMGYEDKEDFIKCLAPLSVENICKTTSPIAPFIYVDYENFCHFELYDMSKVALTTFIRPDIRLPHIKSLVEREEYLSIYITMYSNMLALDFIHNYKRIPKDKIKEIFLHVYQSMDYCFDIFPKEVLDEVFGIIKSENKGSTNLIKIYRGEDTKSTSLDKAMSWSTQKRIAKFFATRFTNQGKIYQGYIRECDAIHIDNDAEYEVICLYEDIKDIREIN